MKKVNNNSFTSKPKKTAIAQYRISSGKQEREWDSFGNQDLNCKKYCSDNNIELVKIFKETVTWKKSAEETFKESIEYGKNNKIDYFIIFDIDRFTRDWYGTYEKVKKNIEKAWMELKDAKNIIQPSNVVFTDDLVDLSKYERNIETPSEYAEAILATNAKIEWKKILQRTILREIQLEQMWYQVRQPNYWFMNQRIPIHAWKAVIQVPRQPESDCVKEIYEYRAKWVLSDAKIVEKLTLKWYRKRSGKIFTPQDIQRMIQNSVYAWVIKTKWTWNNPIKTPYDWLVSIHIWNKANRGKVEIIEIGNNELKIQYDDGKIKKVNEPIIVRKRQNYNPEYPYKSMLKCPHCWWLLRGSSSTWWSGKKFTYYHCSWTAKNRHPLYSVPKSEAHEIIESMLKRVKMSNSALKLFEEASKEVFQEQTQNFKNNKNIYKQQIKELNNKESNILNNIDKIINFPTILEAKNKEVEEIKLLREKLEIKINQKPINNDYFNKFLHYSKQALEHLDKLAMQKEKPELISLVFHIIFDWKIEYEKIKVGTANIIEFMSIESQEKSPQNEGKSSDFVMGCSSQKILNDSNKEYNQMKKFVKRLIKIIDEFMAVIESIKFNKL